MKRNKIIFVTPYFYPHTGGLENYVYNIAKGFKKNYKWDVVVITSSDKNGKKKTETINGIKIYRLPTWFKISNTPINPLWFLHIKEILKKEKPNLINAHSPVPFIADMAALAAGSTPFVLTYHTGSMKKNKFFTDILILMYEKFFIKYVISKSEYVICSSSFVKNFLKDKHSLKKKTFIINPGVDIKRQTKNKKNGYNILFVGGLGKAEKHKGLNYLIKAVETLKMSFPKVKLTVVGDGNARTGYKNSAFKLGLKNNITFKGQLKNGQLREVYSKSNVLVLPSINESFGTVLIEAMARKIPVIGSNVGGIPEIIDNNKNGFTFNPKDSNELAKTIGKVLKNKGLAKRLGEAGFRKVQNKYLWKYQIEQTDNLFKKAIYEK